MEEYYIAGHEKLKRLVCLHHAMIWLLLDKLREKEVKEVEFWNSLREDLEAVR